MQNVVSWDSTLSRTPSLPLPLIPTYAHAYSYFPPSHLSPFLSSGSGVADNLKLIDAALDIRCHALSEESTFPQVEVGQSVCAKSSEDVLWYRATIKKVKDSSAIVSDVCVFVCAP